MAMGGVGEAMLLQSMLTGAAAGGIGSAITGGDPLRGALIGGFTGGAGSVLGGAGGALGGAEAALAAPAADMAPTLANAAAMNAAVAPTALPGFSGAPGTNFLNVPGLSNFAPSSAAAPGITSFSNAVTPAAPSTFMEGMSQMAQDPTQYIMDNKYKLGASALAGAVGGREDPKELEKYNGVLRQYRFRPETYRAAYAEGGIADLASSGYGRMVGEESMNPMYMAYGGISDLGGYSDYARGGRMLHGPGDGMSDSIPASIAGRRPARLANEEFVVPADVVSHLGNGSSDAGAKQLYAMMDRVRKARTGRKSQGREINPQKYMAA